MEGSEKRRDPRVPLVLRVDYPGTQGTERDATENLSAGGLFIRTDRELAPGDRVPLLVSFPGLLAPIEVEVEVVRVRPPDQGPAGVAVRIPDDRQDQRERLRALVESTRAAEGPPTRSYRVLVVEDNPLVVEIYQHALQRVGQGRADVQVEYAQNGHVALARLARSPRVDLVIADLFMPVMDGFALVERMRTDPALMAVPVMVISAGGAEARARAQALGVDVYLQKPVHFTDIIQTVRALLRLRA
jgi:uncharacterized protein (TIGR02266 family)